MLFSSHDSRLFLPKNQKAGKICLMKRKLLKGCLLLLTVFICAQNTLPLDPSRSVYFYQHKQWTIENDMPMNSILAINQTPDGYLWLGTEMGLVRFDGVNSRVFNRDNTPTFSSNLIIRLEVDKRGALWIGTRGGGVMRYIDNRFQVFTTADGLLNNEAWAIKTALDGSVWIGTRGGLNRYYDGKITAVPLPGAMGNHYIKTLLEDRRGRIWAGTRGGGVGLVKKRGGDYESDYVGLNGQRISAVMQDRDGVIWIGTLEKGIFRLQGKHMTNLTTKDGLTMDNISALHQDRDGNTWIGTYGGGLNVIRAGKTTIDILDEHTGLGGNAVVKIFEDRENTLWIGTESGGLCQLRDTKITTYTRQNGLSNNVAVGVFQDSRGNVWSGTIGFGVNRLKPGEEQFITYTTKNGLGCNLVYSFAEYPEKSGNIWFGTTCKGINRMNLDTGKIDLFTSEHGLSENFSRALYVDKDGIFWAGTDDGGVHRFDDNRFHLVTQVKYRVNTLFKDKKRVLWIGTFGGGLMRYFPDGQTECLLDIPGGMESKMILDMHQDQDGGLWFGTSYHGLYYKKYNEDSFFNIRKNHGLPDDTAYCILEDGKHNLWISSNRGIYCLNRRQLEAFMAGEPGQLNPTVYGTVDGMRSMECNGGNQPAGWRTTGGRIWFPTTRGLSVIDPERITINPLPPPVQLEEIRFDNTAFLPGKDLEVPPGQGKLEVNFTALSFIVPEKIRFKYQLEGHDKQWVDAGTRRSAEYDGLSPGDYTFKVMACNSDGVWNHEGTSFRFHLKPHFYQTLLFKLGLPLFLLLVSALAVRIGRKYFRLKILSRRYKRQRPNGEDEESCLKKILYHIEVGKIYRDSNLSLNTMASKLLVSPRTISQVINDRLKKNFFECINHYRVKEAQQMLLDPELGDKTILDIGYDVGFNSKSAFNRAFKKVTKMTPSEYRKRSKRATS